MWFSLGSERERPLWIIQVIPTKPQEPLTQRGVQESQCQTQKIRCDGEAEAGVRQLLAGGYELRDAISYLKEEKKKRKESFQKEYSPADTFILDPWHLF